MPLPQTIRGVRVLSGSVELGRGIVGRTREVPHTSITVVPNLRHTMISRKDESGFLVPVKPRDEMLSSFYDVVHDFDVIHVLLTIPGKIRFQSGGGRRSICSHL